MRQGAPGQTPAALPGVDPGAGEGRVVDEPDLGEAVEQPVGDLGRDVALGERPGQLGPAARPVGEPAQQDLPGDVLGVLGRVVAGVCRLGPPALAGAPGQKSTSLGSAAAAAGSATAGSSTRGPTPYFSLTRFSISSARSGLSRRNARAFSLP